MCSRVGLVPGVLVLSQGGGARPQRGFPNVSEPLLFILQVLVGDKYIPYIQYTPAGPLVSRPFPPLCGPACTGMPSSSQDPSPGPMRTCALGALANLDLDPVTWDRCVSRRTLPCPSRVALCVLRSIEVLNAAKSRCCTHFLSMHATRRLSFF